MSMRAARRAGHHAETTATSASPMAVPSIIDVSPHTRTVRGTGSTCPGGSQVRPAWFTSQATNRAAATPAAAPIRPSRKASLMNSRRMPERRRPMARRVPISAVRSITAMLMVLPTVNSTIAPISTAMKPKMAANMPTAWP